MKLLNRAISISAVIGIILFVGAIGHVDYCAEIGKSVSDMTMIRNMIIACLFCVPALAREVM